MFRFRFVVKVVDTFLHRERKVLIIKPLRDYSNWSICYMAKKCSLHFYT